MLRWLYVWLLRLHPPYFRQRFAEEMLWIFDQAAGRPAPLRLVMDGVVSLARQWTLRPEFWSEPLAAGHTQPAADGVPRFYTFDDWRPRRTALFQGGVLALAAFNAVSIAIGHSRSPLPRPPRPRLVHAGASRSWTSAAPAAANTSFDEPAKLWSAPKRVWSRIALWLSRNRQSLSALRIEKVELSGPYEIVVVVRTRSGSWWRLLLETARAASGGIAQFRTVSFVDETPPVLASVSEQVLRSYAGTYAAEAPDNRKISITLENGQLNLKIDGQPATALVAVSETKFLAAGATERWIEFVKDADGKVTQLNLFQSGKLLKCRRW